MYHYWPIDSSILSRRTPFPDRSQSRGSQRAGHSQSDPAHIDARPFFFFFFFFACGSSAPVRVEHEGVTASWVEGTLVAPRMQGHGLCLPQELWPYQSLFFQPLVPGDQDDPWPVFLHGSTLSCI